MSHFEIYEYLISTSFKNSLRNRLYVGKYRLLLRKLIKFRNETSRIPVGVYLVFCK